MRFLAVLELYKQGVVDLEQAATFAELDVTWIGSLATRDGTVAPAVAERPSVARPRRVRREYEG